MISWRPFRSADEAALRARHVAQNAAFAFPDLADPRFVLVEVAEKDGQIIGAVGAHVTIELMFVGADSLVVRAAVRDRARFAGQLRALGADEAHVFVPNRLLAGMEPLLVRLGFRRSNQDYTPFYQEL
ncbi:MAG: hypothetical protein EPN33_03555 [Acidobacteria bacterium]|nr:MAG: hypothetical protein EPN33_03555 [Acidobacteriota bacterium]